MTVEETKVFTLIDGFARSRHDCFLAEMFLSKEKDEYVLCLRPTHTGPSSRARFACRYVRIGAPEVRQMGLTAALSAGLTDALEHELISLAKAAADRP